MKARRCFLETVAVLVLFSAAREAGLLGPSRYDWVSVSLLVVALALVAWTAGATWADLGLSRTDAVLVCVTGPVPSGSCCWSWCWPR